MIKILFFTTCLSEGGAEKVLCNLVNNMDQSKFDITVQTIDDCVAEKYLTKGIRYRSINRYKNSWMHRLHSYWFRFCAALGLAHFLYVRESYDIEVAYLETGPTKIISQSRSRTSKKVAWVHCDLSLKEGMQRAAKRISSQYDKFDKIVCVSEGVRRGFQKLFGDKHDTLVLHNVIDEQEIFDKSREPLPAMPLNQNTIKITAVGRLTREKNFSYLIETCAKIKGDGFDISASILGDGPEKGKLEEQIHSLELEKNVKLRGFVSNPYPWIKMSDIIVCSSLYEGLSTVVQEALILGKVIVTTPCAGMQELLGNSEYGIIVDNSEDGLYRGIASLMNDQLLIAHYQRKAEERGAVFFKGRAIRLTEKFFHSLMITPIERTERGSKGDERTQHVQG